MKTLYTYDTRVDVSRQDAARRAVPYLGGRYAVEAAQPGRGGQGAEWNTLAQHKGWTTVSVEPGYDAGAPEDTKTVVYRIRQIVVQPQADGWQGPPSNITAFITLERQTDSEPWKVTAVVIR